MSTIRAFIALDFSEAVLRNLEKVSHALQQRLSKTPVRWVAVKHIHLTLKFLGELNTQHVNDVETILVRAAQSQSAFEMQLAELGAFPSLSRPRVIWVGVQAPIGLARLQEEIDLQTARLGYASEDRPFTPHLTLGRVGRDVSPQEHKLIGEALRLTPAANLGVSPVKAVHLYRSDLRPDGPIYTRLVSAELQPLDHAKID